jgi:hypothetical protein
MLIRPTPGSAPVPWTLSTCRQNRFRLRYRERSDAKISCFRRLGHRTDAGRTARDPGTVGISRGYSRTAVTVLPGFASE